MEGLFAVLGLAMIALFMAAQGGAIFATAYGARRLLGGTGSVSKLGAMLASWMAWVIATVIGYVAIGGEGGFMDGAMLIILPLFLSIFSVAAYTALWIAIPALQRRAAKQL